MIVGTAEEMQRAWADLGGWKSPKISVQVYCVNRHLLGAIWRKRPFGYLVVVRVNHFRVVLPEADVFRTFAKNADGSVGRRETLRGGMNLTAVDHRAEAGADYMGPYQLGPLKDAGFEFPEEAFWHCGCKVWSPEETAGHIGDFRERLASAGYLRGEDAIVGLDGALIWQRRR